MLLCHCIKSICISRPVLYLHVHNPIFRDLIRNNLIQKLIKEMEKAAMIYSY